MCSPFPLTAATAAQRTRWRAWKADLGALAGTRRWLKPRRRATARARPLPRNLIGRRKEWERIRRKLSMSFAARGRGRVSSLRCPPVLASDKAEGSSQREAWRRFSVGTLQPAGRAVAEELSDKLDVPGLRIHFEGLASADLAGKARAVGIFTKAGVPLARALEMAGLRG